MGFASETSLAQPLFSQSFHAAIRFGLRFTPPHQRPQTLESLLAPVLSALTGDSINLAI